MSYFSNIANEASQRSITANLWSLTVHIYHVMIIVTGGLSKKSFLLLLPRYYFEQSLGI